MGGGGAGQLSALYELCALEKISSKSPYPENANEKHTRETDMEERGGGSEVLCGVSCL